LEESGVQIERPWLAGYPEGMRWDLEAVRQPVYEMLEEAAKTWPDRPAIAFMGAKISYRELESLVARAAKGFQLLGVKPGVHVGLFLANTPHYVVSFMGVLRAGGTVVNYSPLDAERTLEHKIEDSETDLMVTLDLDGFYPQMAKLLGRTRLQKLVVGSTLDLGGTLPAGAQPPGRQVEFDQRCLSFASLLDNDGRFTPYPIDADGSALAVLQYTGGTTGAPKGAMLTHANLSSSCGQLLEILAGALEPGNERVLAVLPPFHIYALMINMLFSIRIGAEAYLHQRFDVGAVLEEISRNKITTFPAVPTMFIGLLNHPEVGKYDLSSLKMCNSGGAPLPLEVQQQFQKASGCSLKEGWGMTETSTTGTFTPMDSVPRAGSCGMPAPGIDIRIAQLDNPDVSVPLGERGELCIAGANVTPGYWKRPDATAESMSSDGYLRTGDVGYMDEDGYIYIVDRTKDMILCSGYNVYPRTIEEAIYEHPAVEEVSVIGVDDAYRGQSPKAFIKLKAGAAPFELPELQEFLKGRLGRHEMVHAMEIRDELPKTPVGKLSKKELQDEERARAKDVEQAV
jgi:long-chain acyl-CoA synthetase